MMIDIDYYLLLSIIGFFFFGVGLLTPRPTPNLGGQVLLLVCPLYCNLPGLVGPARSLCLARIRLHCYKKCFKVNKDAKFKSDVLKTNEKLTSKYSENLQTFVWLELSQWCPHRINVCKIWLE